MKVEQYHPELSIKITPSALEHAQKEVSKQPRAIGIRIFLQTSGCSGYMYETELVEQSGQQAQQEDEQLFLQENGVQLFIKRKDFPILNGTTIDFVTQGLNSHFQFKNPNATAECGCGESFSVESL